MINSENIEHFVEIIQNSLRSINKEKWNIYVCTNFFFCYFWIYNQYKITINTKYTKFLKFDPLFCNIIR